jgi:hypothetical protein
MGTEIKAAGVGFDIGIPVRLWSDEDGLNAYPLHHYKGRDVSFNELQDQIRQVVWHHSVTYRAKETFDGVAARGLSVNFIIDDDDVEGVATLYQCLDVKDIGYSQKANNHLGPGVEISYHPEGWSNPNLYSEENRIRHRTQPHPLVEETLHGQIFKGFAPTEAQMRTVFALAWGLGELFPAVPVHFPRASDGTVSSSLLSKPLDYIGHVCHYHIDGQKIDAFGLNVKRIEEEAARRALRGF